MENERADAGQDGGTSLARSNSQARTETGESSLFSVQLSTSRIGDHTAVGPYSVLSDDRCTYKHIFRALSLRNLVLGY